MKTIYSRVRTALVVVIVVSYSIAAVAGILVLLGGSEGEFVWKILSTTAIVGAFSVATLACVALWGRAAQLFGAIGVAVTVASAALAITLVWLDRDAGETVSRLLVTGILLSAAWALASLLLLLVTRQRPAVRWGLVATLAVIAVMTLIAVLGVWWDDLSGWEDYPRILGVFGILAALGVVVVPVLALLMPDTPRESAGLPPALAAQLTAAAARRGITVDELVAPVLVEPAPDPGQPT
ncbi:hypothetical protein GCM10009808_24020 [Microbacterium sediminicola]|uniref:Uncharacterized protein n=1 Tax=Microbacterium sediminicola TaxID=415210 RepID=A0ABP4UGI1_9MICO